jgi:hypothetical protein
MTTSKEHPMHPILLRRHTASVIGLSLFLFAGLLPAHAALKVYPGGRCQAFDAIAGGARAEDGLLMFQSGWLTCGLVRTTTTNTNGLTSLTVYANTGDGGTGYSCYGYSVSSTGSVLKSVQMNLIGVANQEQTLSFGNQVNVSNATSSYAVSCLVARFATLRQVRYNE